MDNDKQVRKELAFKATIKRLFNTKDGKEFLAGMKDSYVYNTAVGKDPYDTYYKLGVKEFIEGLIRNVKDPEELDDIIIRNNMED